MDEIRSFHWTNQHVDSPYDFLFTFSWTCKVGSYSRSKRPVGHEVERPLKLLEEAARF